MVSGHVWSLRIYMLYIFFPIVIFGNIVTLVDMVLVTWYDVFLYCFMILQNKRYILSSADMVKCAYMYCFVVFSVCGLSAVYPTCLIWIILLLYTSNYINKVIWYVIALCESALNFETDMHTCFLLFLSVLILN
jgi:hypothetical protein